jgi:hypothetical protein
MSNIERRDVERRPHLQRPCPFRLQEGCGWMQTTSWFVGGPDITQPVSELTLRMEAEAHFLKVHPGQAPRRIFI